MPIKLNAQHLASAAGGFEPQRANNGILVIEGLEGWDQPDGPIALSLESFPLPKESNTIIEARYMNERRKFAGPANVDDMEIVVKDMVDIQVARMLLKWRRQVYDPAGNGQWGSGVPGMEQGAVGLARTYKKTGTITLIPPDRITDGRIWGVSGIWPTTMNPGDVDMTSEDFIKITITLAVDRIWQTDLTGLVREIAEEQGIPA